MNEMNWLEAQLKSWAPRRPSAKIERRLFAPRMSPAVTAELRRAFAWFAPVAACVVLVLAVARQEGAASGGPRPDYMYAMILSNQINANFLPGAGCQPENHVDRASFEWTNRAGSGSSIRFMPSTNISL